MVTALDILIFIGFIPLAYLYFIGMGWLIAGFAIHGSLVYCDKRTSLMREIPITLLSGIILNYSLMLIFQRLNISLVAGIVLALIGLITWTISLRKRQYHWELTELKTGKLVGIILTLALVGGSIIVEPLVYWDSRSIWFFHGKMIFSAATLGVQAGWQEPGVVWSHVDYPILIPSLAGQIGSIFGFWNDFLPKFSLLFALTPAIFWLFSFAKKNLGFILLYLVLPFSFFPHVWNGHMDGLLAFYFALALLLYWRYEKDQNTLDLLAFLGCTFFLLSLKNEGLLAVIALVLSVFFSRILQKKRFDREWFLKLNWRYILLIIAFSFPFILWSVLKQRWHLENDLGLGTRDSLIRVIDRLSDGSLSQVIKTEFIWIKYNLLVLILTLFAAFRWKISTIKELIPSLIASGLIFIGITIVYLETPRDLSWHLNTSVDRTMFLVNGGLICAWFMVLSSIEQFVSGDAQVNLQN